MRYMVGFLIAAVCVGGPRQVEASESAGTSPRKMPVFLAVGADVAACRNKVG